MSHSLCSCWERKLHNAARASTKGRCLPGEVADQDRRGRAGDSWHIVVLGYPEPREAPVFRVFGKVRRILKRFRDSAACPKGREILDRESRVANVFHVVYTDGRGVKEASAHVVDITERNRPTGRLPSVN